MTPRISKKHQTNVAFQGEPGAYSEAAAYLHFGHDITTLPCETFDQVFYSVTEEEASQGVIPIENSLAGSIHRNYDLMQRYDLMITGEYYLRVNHCLLALPGVQLKEIQRVHSHPQALAQCEANITKLGLSPIAERDTAGSARWVKDNEDRHAAALASRHAASVYNLQVLRENMEDNPANFTRFLALSKDTQSVEFNDEEDFKTSIVFSLPNKPGSLYKALSVFALRDIDLTKIESRPIAGKPWEYLFYIDFAGHIGTDVCSRAINHLNETAPFLEILGSYKRHKNNNEIVLE
ncbi:MAG: prephenate dehydratase [Chloroflexi bacterium]|nr:prephenate dehydratase [Chloroflexota bacterium]